MNAKGLDLSRYNGRGDWNAALTAGVSFVIIKAGGVYYSNGVCYQDDLLADHVAGARSVGLPFGLYWYFLPFTPVTPQINFYRELIETYQPTIPAAFIDCESNNGKSISVITATLKQFIPAFSNMLHPAVIYTRQSWWDYNVAAASWGGYDLWAARWASYLTSPWSDGHFVFRDWADWRFWQVGGENNNLAKIYGFPGPPEGDPDMDVNYFNGTVSQLRDWAGLPPLPGMTCEERLERLEKAVFGV